MSRVLSRFEVLMICGLPSQGVSVRTQRSTMRTYVLRPVFVTVVFLLFAWLWRLA